MARMKLSVGSNAPPNVILYDENGDAIALMSVRRANRSEVAQAIADAVNTAGGIDIDPLPEFDPRISG